MEGEDWQSWGVQWSRGAAGSYSKWNWARTMLNKLSTDHDRAILNCGTDDSDWLTVTCRILTPEVSRFADCIQSICLFWFLSKTFRTPRPHCTRQLCQCSHFLPSHFGFSTILWRRPPAEGRRRRCAGARSPLTLLKCSRATKLLRSCRWNCSVFRYRFGWKGRSSRRERSSLRDSWGIDPQTRNKKCERGQRIGTTTWLLLTWSWTQCVAINDLAMRDFSAVRLDGEFKEYGEISTNRFRFSKSPFIT